MASVDELQGSTAKITSHLDRLQTVEKDLAALKAAVPQKEDVGKVRSEMKKVYVSCARAGVRCRASGGIWQGGTQKEAGRYTRCGGRAVEGARRQREGWERTRGAGRRRRKEGDDRAMKETKLVESFERAVEACLRTADLRTASTSSSSTCARTFGASSRTFRSSPSRVS